jgi:exonuclease VII small subunit
MASMSYCLFENTASELDRCVERMEEAESLDEMNLNEYEERAFMAMFQIARNFLAEHERLINAGAVEVDLADKCFE